jgi:sodium-independent sulfate anion transporter 11
MLCFCSGFLILFLGVFNLGSIVNYISNPVLVGFISAASIIIPCGLLEKVFGISGLPGPFLPKMVALAMNLGKMRYYDAIIGFATLGTLLALKHGKIRL